MFTVIPCDIKQNKITFAPQSALGKQKRSSRQIQFYKEETNKQNTKLISFAQVDGFSNKQSLGLGLGRLNNFSNWSPAPGCCRLKVVATIN